MSYAVGKEQRAVEEWQVIWGRPYNHSVASQVPDGQETRRQLST